MSSIYSIYKATNTITNQSYIGFDSRWPKRRTDHHREYQKEKFNIKFYNAIRKYGWDNFVWELLYQAKESVPAKDSHTLNVMEPHFIKEHNSFTQGYNMTLGGDRGPVLFGDANGMFGKTHTKEVRENAAKMATKRFKGYSYEQLYGTEKANEMKKKRSEKAKVKDNSGIKNPRYDKTIYTFNNIETGEIFVGDRLSFNEKHNISRPSICEIVNDGRIRKKWTIL